MAEEKGEKKDGGNPRGDKPNKFEKSDKPEKTESHGDGGKRVPLSS